MFPKRCTFNEIRMKQETPTFGADRFIWFRYPDNLARSGAYQGAFLVVVMPPSILQVATFKYFQVDGKDAEIIGIVGSAIYGDLIRNSGR